MILQLLSLPFFGAAIVMSFGTYFAWKQRHSDRIKAVAVYVAIVIVGLILAIGGALPASAHDHWINNSNYKSLTDGTHCCGKNDCFEFKDVRAMPDGWWIVVLNEIVPYSDTQASEDNKFWRCKRYDGSRRCFFAPMPSS